MSEFDFCLMSNSCSGTKKTNLFLSQSYNYLPFNVCPISVQVWDVFGEQRGASGGFLVCFLHKWAMLGASHLTPPTMRCVQVSLTVRSPPISKRFPNHKASSSFTVPKLMLCCSLRQNIPFICSELPRVHYSLPDPQPFPLPLYDLLVARQFRRDEMEGGMQL